MLKEKQYVLTYHAFDEMIADDLNPGILRIILHGAIIRTEMDK